MSAVPFEAILRPKLRPGVSIRRDGGGFMLSYGEQECQITAEAEDVQPMGALLDLLKEGVNTQDIARLVPALAEDAADVLDELDRLGLLQELSVPDAKVVSGEQLFHEVIRFSARIKADQAEGSLYERMRDGSCSIRHLVGYALEYYHVVRMAPQLVAPAMAKTESKRSELILRNFFVSELNHDRMLAAALKAVGIEGEQLDTMIPLPTTFALCSALGAYAAQHPLSFKACLFLFEETSPEFNEAFRAACEAKGLPQEFWKPILQHANINDNFAHGDISLELLRTVLVVGEEERITVLKHAGIMTETLLRHERELLSYYGEPENPLPRIWA